MNLSRAGAIAMKLAVAVCASSPASATDAIAPACPAPYAFKVGAFECFVLYDMTAVYDAGSFFINAPEAELAAALARTGAIGAEIASPYEALLVRTGKNVVLIDTGAGPSTDPTKGRLRENLAKIGVNLAEIDTVLLTHGHLDHIGGTLGTDGQPAFPNARYVMFQQEWDFWDQEVPDLSAVGITDVARKRFIEIGHKQLRPLRDHLELISANAEVRPGIFAMFAGGHTPGHMVVRLESCGEQLLYVSDLVLSPLALEHPDWHTRYECDVASSQATKQRFLEYAAHEGLLVHAMHFPWPGLGHILPDGEHWIWRPCPGPIS